MSLVRRMRQSAGNCSLLASSLKLSGAPRQTLSDVITDISQGANSLEDLAEVALEVFRLASRKGMLFATDPDTGSDKLVGYFLPPKAIHDLFDAAKDFKKEGQ